MINSISTWLYKKSTGWVTFLALALFLVFMATILPAQAAAAETNARGGNSPDMSFTYTKEDLYAMAERHGENGREAYIRARFTFDLVFPLVYTAFLITSISWLFIRAFPAISSWQVVNLAPIFGMIFDFLENGATSLVFARFPNQTPLVDWLAPVFTLVKWIFVGGSFVLLLAGIGVITWHWLTNRITPTRS